MDIQKVINPKDYEVGVIIARFQVHQLHEAHHEMINLVRSNHKKIIIFLGISRAMNTKRNPLDYATREAMIKKHYPTVVVLPMMDQRSDKIWSENLDQAIYVVFGSHRVLLYGSRDSFIPHYKGKHKTTELTTTIEVSGTQIRHELSQEIIESRDFRHGVIHSIYAGYDKTFPTVDVCAYNDKGQILLARKPNENKWRFIGGFVDKDDSDYEMAARREFSEETDGSSVGSLQYICSKKIEDWRYRGESDGIMSTLFLGRYGHGICRPSDDIEELKWFDVNFFTKHNNIKFNIMEEHIDMMKDLIVKVYREDLIKSRGEFLKEVPTPIDPDVVVKDETYKIR